jgi:hypothetical protein
MKYDLEQVYDEQIAPLMAQIIATCKDYGLPMVASFAYRCDENGEHDLCTSFVESEGHPAPQCYTWALNRIYTPGTEHERQKA